MAYFDNAATTYPKPEIVYQSMDQFQRHTGGSFGRGNYGFSSSAKSIVDDTRAALQQLLHFRCDKFVKHILIGKLCLSIHTPKECLGEGCFTRAIFTNYDRDIFPVITLCKVDGFMTELSKVFQCYRFE